jgi:chorismate-pyruvate lyase
MLIPDTARGKRLEADALREGAARLITEAKELERLADQQEYHARRILIGKLDSPWGNPY